MIDLPKVKKPFASSKLLTYITVVVVVFLAVSYFTNTILNFNEARRVSENESNLGQKDEVFYYGRVQYVGKGLYSADEVVYVLVDTNGNQIYLLKSTDDKLAIADGHYAKIFGSIVKTQDGTKDIILVSKVVMSSSDKKN